MNRFKNRLLRAMEDADLQSLCPHLEAVDLAKRMAIDNVGKPIEAVYFLETGLAAVVAQSTQGVVGVAVLGNDGMTGLGAVLGSDLAAYNTVIQAESTAHRITAKAFKAAMAASPSLHSLLLRYVHVFTLQASQTALMNTHGSMEQRLATWILMSFDRFGREDLAVTHEFIALMLGVRRQGITTALHSLEGMGLLKPTRAKIQVVDRPGLVALSGGGHGICEDEYARLIPPADQ